MSCWRFRLPLGDEVAENPDLEEKEMSLIPPMHYLTKFQVWILRLLERIKVGRYSAGDLVRRSCWGISDYCPETDVTWQSWIRRKS